MNLVDLFEKNEDGTWKLDSDHLPILTPAGREKIKKVFQAAETKSGVPFFTPEQMEKIRNTLGIIQQKLDQEAIDRQKDELNN